MGKRITKRSEIEMAIRAAMVYAGIGTQGKLAEQLGVSAVTAGNKLKHPETFTAKELQKVVGTLNIDPGVMLKFLGYKDAEIRDFKSKN